MYSEQYSLKRRELIKVLVGGLDDILIISGLGAPSWDLAAAGDRDLTYPLWGAMGGSAMIGLGLALSQPNRQVIVITGDGEILMGLGSLSTIAQMRPNNLSIVVLDNERYGETGMQPTHTAGLTDIAGVARACGFEQAATLYEADEFDQAMPAILAGLGPSLFVIKVCAEHLPIVVPPRDPSYLKDRFRIALLGKKTAENFEI